MNDTTNTIDLNPSYNHPIEPPKTTATVAFLNGGWEVSIARGNRTGSSVTETDLAASIAAAAAELIATLHLDNRRERLPLAVQDMTMRDRFAAQIAGPLAAVPGQTERKVARKAYAIADAMITERE